MVLYISSNPIHKLQTLDGLGLRGTYQLQETTVEATKHHLFLLDQLYLRGTKVFRGFIYLFPGRQVFVSAAVQIDLMAIFSNAPTTSLSANRVTYSNLSAFQILRTRCEANCLESRLHLLGYLDLLGKSINLSKKMLG
jgi:hypothetical protein